MLLQPKKTRYKKLRKGKLKYLKFNSYELNFGTIGLKSVNSGVISAKQLEAARQAISRKTNRKGKIWIKVFPDTPVTAKPNESRMGKGKGSVKYWVAKVRGGTTLFELCGINSKIANTALKTGGAKLPIKTKVFY